jgi:hypothetical protein
MRNESAQESPRSETDDAARAALISTQSDGDTIYMVQPWGWKAEVILSSEYQGVDKALA